MDLSKLTTEAQRWKLISPQIIVSQCSREHIKNVLIDAQVMIQQQAALIAALIAALQQQLSATQQQEAK